MDDTNKISSVRLAQNHAQTAISDDIYDTDDTLQMTSSSSLIDKGGISSNKPSELSAIGVGCSTDNKNGDDKPTSTTISTLTANSADITSRTIDTDTNNTIYRTHADILGHVRTVKSRPTNIYAKT
jgi:hypothetical protein